MNQASCYVVKFNDCGLYKAYVLLSLMVKYCLNAIGLEKKTKYRCSTKSNIKGNDEVGQLGHSLGLYQSYLCLFLYLEIFVADQCTDFSSLSKCRFESIIAMTGHGWSQGRFIRAEQCVDTVTTVMVGW